MRKLRYHPHHRFKIGLLFFWILWMTGPASLSLADFGEGSGPFPTRNYNPVQLLFLSLPPEKGTTLSRGRTELSLDLAESNTFLIETNSRVDALLKLETFRAALNIKYGLTNHSEVGLEIPYYHRNGGLMDPFIMNVEDAFNYLNVDRLRYTNRSFGGFTIRRDGEMILSGEDHQFGMGDLVLSGKYIVLSEGSGKPAVALRGAVKLPTGDFDKAFGSGKTDVGIGLVLQKTLSRRWISYLNQAGVVPGGHFGKTGLTLVPIYSAALALEFLATPSFSIVGQWDVYTTPFRGAGAYVLDHHVAETALGFNYRIRPSMVWRLYAIENFVHPVGAYADFTLGTHLAVQF